jgi:hypothetical protein
MQTPATAPTPAEVRRNTPQPVPFFSRELRYEVTETAWLLGQSVPKTWIDIKEGKLRVIREGGRTFVPGSEIARRCALPTEAA